jgi:hypothetical protein
MAPPKDDIRTFYFRAVELGYHLSVFELVSIDGPLPANPRIGERERSDEHHAQHGVQWESYRDRSDP